MLVCPSCRARYVTRVQHCSRDGSPLEERDTDPLVGTAIGRYRIDSYIAEGGTGAVYRATHAELGAPCAVKVLFGELAADVVVVERFRREAQTASRIRSPYVVSVNDFGTTDDGLVYLVMEFTEGRSLSEVIRDEGPLDPLRVARILEDVARGLAAAHKLGFIHRDIKPSNILVQEAGDAEIARITDFGIARPLVRSDSVPELTQAGFVVGTPAYMAPEQAAGRPTSASDLYSLGGVLYHLLAGKKPFEQRGIEDLLRAHATEDPPPLKAPAGLDLLALRLLSKRPSLRHRSADALAEEARCIQVLLQNSVRPGASDANRPGPRVDEIMPAPVDQDPTAAFDVEVVPVLQPAAARPSDLFVERDPTPSSMSASSSSSSAEELLFDDETEPSSAAPGAREAASVTDEDDADVPTEEPVEVTAVAAAPVRGQPGPAAAAGPESTRILFDAPSSVAEVTHVAVEVPPLQEKTAVVHDAPPSTSESAPAARPPREGDSTPPTFPAASPTPPHPLPAPVTFTGHPAAMPVGWHDHPATAPTQWAQLYVPPPPPRFPVWAVVFSTFLVVNLVGVGLWASMNRDRPAPPSPSCVLADGFRASALISLERGQADAALRDLTRALQLACDDSGELARLVAIAKNQQVLASRAKAAEAELSEKAEEKPRGSARSGR